MAWFGVYVMVLDFDPVQGGPRSGVPPDLCHVLLDPAYDVNATSSSQDDIVVEIHTDEGLTGIGETDLNAWVARACIELPGTHTMDRGLARMLLGADPMEVEGLWDRLYIRNDGSSS